MGYKLASGLCAQNCAHRRPGKGLLAQISRRFIMDLLIQKVADKMGENWGAGHPAKS
jgi:histidinol phosphatase-like enzyme